MESRRRYGGIFTWAIPTVRCVSAIGAGSFVVIGARTKWRGDTVALLNRQPVKTVHVAATTKKSARQERDFMAVVLAVFFPSTRLGIAFKKFCEIGHGTPGVTEFLQCLYQVRTKRASGSNKSLTLRMATRRPAMVFARQIRY